MSPRDAFITCPFFPLIFFRCVTLMLTPAFPPQSETSNQLKAKDSVPSLCLLYCLRCRLSDTFPFRPQRSRNWISLPFPNQHPDLLVVCTYGITLLRIQCEVSSGVPRLAIAPSRATNSGTVGYPPFPRRQIVLNGTMFSFSLFLVGHRR